MQDVVRDEPDRVSTVRPLQNRLHQRRDEFVPSRGPAVGLPLDRVSAAEFHSDAFAQLQQRYFQLHDFRPGKVVPHYKEQGDILGCEVFSEHDAVSRHRSQLRRKFKSSGQVKTSARRIAAYSGVVSVICIHTSASCCSTASSSRSAFSRSSSEADSHRL